MTTATLALVLIGLLAGAGLGLRLIAAQLRGQARLQRERYQNWR